MLSQRYEKNNNNNSDNKNFTLYGKCFCIMLYIYHSRQMFLLILTRDAVPSSSAKIDLSESLAGCDTDVWRGHKENLCSCKKKKNPSVIFILYSTMSVFCQTTDWRSSVCYNSYYSLKKKKLFVFIKYFFFFHFYI